MKPISLMKEETSWKPQFFPIKTYMKKFKMKQLNLLSYLTFCALLSMKDANAFMGTRPISLRVSNIAPTAPTKSLLSTSTSNEEELLTEIKSLRVRQLKQELDDAGIDVSDVFEKDELVKRLLDHRKKPKASEEVLENQKQQNSWEKTTPHPSSTVCVPMDFHSLTPDKAVASNNSNIYLRPSPGKYPSINLSIPGQKRPLTLLVDTACSGLILRPSIVKQYNLPTFNAGVTMTAAGGSVEGTSVAKLNGAVMDDGTVLEDLMVAGQDIGALPNKLDGIVGLSFLNQFQSTLFDFKDSKLILEKKKNSCKENGMDLLAKCDMKLCKIGVWTVDVTLDGRGPVKMLVDTGAASSFLNWKGVNALNMDKGHPLISRNTDALGVMGADNNAFQLSHRFVLKRRVNLTSDPSRVGVFDPQGIEMSEPVNIDIGDLPVLETLKYDAVGGILGSDILMRCDLLHFDFNNSSPKMFMLNKLK